MTAQSTYWEETTFEFPIELGAQALLLVKKGQLLSEGEVVGKIKRVTEKEIDLSESLLVKGKQAFKYLTKALGEEVEQGDLIAEKKSFLVTKKVFSPLAGKLDSLTEEGILKICQFFEEEIKTDFSGKVIFVSPEKINLETRALKISGSWGVGKRSCGFLKVLSASLGKEDVFQIQDDILGKILVVSGKISKAFWFKALSLGAVGVLVGDLDKEELKKFSLEQPTVQNGVTEDHFPPLVVIGKSEIDQEILEKLKKLEGKKTLIDGEKAQVIISL